MLIDSLRNDLFYVRDNSSSIYSDECLVKISNRESFKPEMTGCMEKGTLNVSVNLFFSLILSLLPRVQMLTLEYKGLIFRYAAVEHAERAVLGHSQK